MPQGSGLAYIGPRAWKIGFYCLFGFVKIRFDGNAPHYLGRNIYFECLPGQVPSRANLKSTAKSAREKSKHIKYKKWICIYLHSRWRPSCTTRI